jgi:uncharacterized protein
MYRGKARFGVVMRYQAVVSGFAILALWSMMAVLAPAWAESDPTVQSWRITSPIAPRAAPSAPTPVPSTYRARRRYDAPTPRHADDSTLGLHLPEIAIALPQPGDARRTPVAVAGDSLAEALALGMEADPALKASLLIRQKTVSASGLVREDYHDWPKTIAAMVADTPAPAALVVMLGLNDRQVIRLGETSAEPLTEPWKEAYRQRIDAVIRAAQTAKVPLVWVGMPVMRAPRLSADVALLNEMIRERVNGAGETFIDIFDSFADPSGGFAASGPDIIGDTVRLRGPDGIHFTPAGQRKLAFFVDKPLQRRIGEREATQPAVPVAALPETTLPGAPTAETALPVPPPATLIIPIVRPRPEIGEIRPLRAITSAASLVGQQSPPLTDPATRDLFERGTAPAPRAGRSDDYRWR